MAGDFDTSDATTPELAHAITTHVDALRIWGALPAHAAVTARYRNLLIAADVHLANAIDALQAAHIEAELHHRA